MRSPSTIGTRCSTSARTVRNGCAMPAWLTPVLALLGSTLGSVVVTVWRFARLEADVERMKQDIGTHETGMRGAIHRTATHVTELEMRVTILERKDK